MELVIFMGLQASGKSTFYQTHFAQTHAYVSKDQFRHNKNRARRQTQLVEAALAAGCSVVVDNTNPTPSDRAPLIQQGKAHGAKIIGYYFQSQISQSLGRNQQRTGWARVPDIAIYATSKKLLIPTYTEGFDRLFYVAIAENTFEVDDWLCAIPDR